MNTLKVNSLPAPAWNRRNANHTFLDCPEKLRQEHTERTVLGMDGPGIRLNGKALPQAASLPSALGSEAEAYIEQHAEERICLEITGTHARKQPVIISYTLNDSDLVDLLEIHAGEESRATIILSYRSYGKEGGFHGNLVRLYAGARSSIRLVQVQMLGDEWISMDNVAAVCGEQADITVTQIELGAGKAFSGCHAELKGYKSQADLRCYYMGNRDQELDFNYVARHQAGKTKSTIDAHGILMDRSRKTLRGTIDFPTGCAQSSGSEMETVLLLNPEVENVTVPLILCTEEDVEGSHGATIGSLSQEQSFYLNCRGLTEKEIRSLLAESFTESACREALEERLSEEIRRFTSGRRKEGAPNEAFL